jgi:DNA-binding beta-propeller fold protein YncE
MDLNRRRSFVLISATAAAAVLIVWSGEGLEGSARTRTIGRDRLVSVPPIGGSDVDTCPVPGVAPLSVAAATPQQAPAGAAAAAPAAPAVRTRAGNIDKRPARYIKDPYPAWSSIAVNAENDMVIMTDENLFRIVEYARSVNTPLTGPAAEPRRVIGGDKTHMEMLCGSYIDPKTLDVYVTNNDTQDWMPVFSREARGNAVPDRLLATPHQAWGIAADEARQELYLTVQGAAAVVVYRKLAQGTEVPLRILQGDATELADPHGIAIDMKSDLMVVANHGHRRLSGGAMPPMRSREEWSRLWEAGMKSSLHQFVSMYGVGRGRGEDGGGVGGARSPAEANGFGRFEMPSINIYQRGVDGNTPPLRVIKGPKTQLNWPSHVTLHEDRGEIFVANDADDSVLVFRESDSGDAAPIRVIKGPKTRIKFPTGLSLDAKNNELWVASMGNFTATVFPVTANGDVAPVRQIRAGPADKVGLMIGNPGAVGYDSKRQEILVPN